MFIKLCLLILSPMLLYAVNFGEYEFKFHGKFCGDNIPDVRANSKDEEFRLLSKIEPIDVIDSACKKHDLCYVTRGNDDETCDSELVYEMKNIHDKLETKDCRRFAQSIIYYFKIRNDNPYTLVDNHGSLKDKAVKMPSVTFRNMMNTASFSKMTTINYAFQKPVGYIFDSKNNSERRKEVLQIFPPRYKKCNIK